MMACRLPQERKPGVPSRLEMFRRLKVRSLELQGFTTEKAERKLAMESTESKLRAIIKSLKDDSDKPLSRNHAIMITHLEDALLRYGVILAEGRGDRTILSDFK